MTSGCNLSVYEKQTENHLSNLARKNSELQGQTEMPLQYMR